MGGAVGRPGRCPGPRAGPPAPPAATGTDALPAPPPVLAGRPLEAGGFCGSSARLAPMPPAALGDGCGRAEREAAAAAGGFCAAFPWLVGAGFWAAF